MNTYTEKSGENKSRSVANTNTQQKSDRKPAFQFIDNRPEAVAQKKLHELANTQQAIQRLVVFSGANPPEDSNVVATLPDTVKSVGGPVVHSGANPDYSSDNKIALLAHGGPGFIEWKGGDWNGKKLVDDELLADGRAMAAGSLLELWPCSAGDRSGVDTADSLVDAVRAELVVKNVNNVTVKGVVGMHLVLNDVGDHYVPKDGVDQEVVIAVFSKLRSYYLWLFGFFSDQVVRRDLGGFKQETVGTEDGKHPVLYPKNMGLTDEYVKNLKTLYNAEKACNGIDSEMSYDNFIKQRMVSWVKMCSFLRGNAAFQAITKKVNADWFELKS
jgi:hypothetical protein